MATPRDPLSLTPLAWESLARDWRLPEYRGRQIFEALHRRGKRRYEEMRELPGELRARLAREMPVRLPEIARREASQDGSVKYGLRLADGALIEAVFMPGEGARSAVNEFEDARRISDFGIGNSDLKPVSSTPRVDKFTVCLSSQTGCAVDCAFCVTGRLGGGRNLSAGEILAQLYAVLDDLGHDLSGLRVVFMGMGEPFLNPDGVLGALGVLFEFLPPRRVTVSTSGIVPAFDQFAALPRRPDLAVSVNAADEETRSRLMPINRTYPLASLIRALRKWPLETRRRITAEYVLIAGVNDSPEDARRLAKLLSGIPVKINLIPLNEDPTYLAGWSRPDESAIERFARVLSAAGATVTVRRSKGPDARAACGQLKGRAEDPRRRALPPPPARRV